MTIFKNAMIGGLSLLLLILMVGMTAETIIASEISYNRSLFASAESAAGDFAPLSNNKESEHGDSDLNPLGTWQTNTAVWTVVVFLILFGLLTKFAFKPIIEGLDKRELAIADNILEAERANRNAKELLNQYQQKLSEAESEVKAIVESGKKEAERAGESIIAKAREVAEAERIRAAKEIESATDGALQELAERSANLAVSLAGKIIREKLDPQAHANLIQNAVSDFSKN
ncbi:MAG: F0F1 ATP synthase subunit B [Planctomycetaceae bacterium]|jgi:F-type H+-transporting ATPase subunit b|nr:F0F1 ATP synthase subunit B [Planctomycetaceae bacterium]